MHKKLRNRVVRLIANAKSEFIKDEIMKNKDNSKQLWRVLKRVALIMSNSNTSSSVEINGKTVKRSKVMADGFNKYLTDIRASTRSTEGEYQSKLDYLNNRLIHFVSTRVASKEKFYIPAIIRNYKSEMTSKIWMVLKLRVCISLA